MKKLLLMCFVGLMTFLVPMKSFAVDVGKAEIVKYDLVPHTHDAVVFDAGIVAETFVVYNGRDNPEKYYNYIYTKSNYIKQQVSLTVLICVRDKLRC